MEPRRYIQRDGWRILAPDLRVALVIVPPAQMHRFVISMAPGDDPIEIMQELRDLCFPSEALS